MELCIQIITISVYLRHCNYSSIQSQKRNVVQISPLQLCQILVSMQSRERSLLQGYLNMAIAALGKMKQRSAINLREPEFRPFKTIFLHLWHSMYSANHPRP